MEKQVEPLQIEWGLELKALVLIIVGNGLLYFLAYPALCLNYSIASFLIVLSYTGLKFSNLLSLDYPFGNLRGLVKSLVLIKYPVVFGSIAYCLLKLHWNPFVFVFAVLTLVVALILQTIFS